MPLDMFIGRANELQHYQKFLTRDNPWVLMIRGLGGSGKTTLLSEFANQAIHDTCVVTLDFAEETLREDYLSVLESLSQQLEPYCFDPHKAVDFQDSVQEGRFQIGKRVSRGDTIVTNPTEKLDAAPNAQVKDASFTMNIGKESLEETIHQMREIARHKFYDQVRTFRLQRLVVMLDNCEWLNEQTPEIKAAHWAGTELMKGLRGCLQGVGRSCYVIMASQVPIKLEGINNSEIDQILLKMFSKNEVNQYLEAMEIRDPIMQDAICNMTHGHPHSLAIVYDLWQQQWDRPLDTGDLPRLEALFYEEAVEDVIKVDVLNQLLKPPLNELTRYGVLLYRFNLPLLRAVFKEWLPDTADALQHFEQLIRYPYIVQLGNFTYMIHMLLREILSRDIRGKDGVEAWRRYHERALKYLEQADLHSPDWYYHLLAYDEAQGRDYWNQVKADKSQEYLESLREAARDRTLFLTPATLQCLGIQRDASDAVA